MHQLGARFSSYDEDFANCLIDCMRLFKSNDKEELERDIDAELHFHVEELTRANLQYMTPEEAKISALKRFGNLERVKEQCVEISRRSNPFLRAVKFLLLVILLAGVLLRVLSVETTLKHCGDLLIAVSLLTRMLLYVRGLNPSSFSKPENSSPLKLRETSFTAFDKKGLTPFERVISDK